MNNMQFDETTQTYQGTVGPYHLSEDMQAFTGTNKPLQLPFDWADQPYLNGLPNYWQNQTWREVWENFSSKPLPLTQQPGPQDALMHQLAQAMAGFAASEVGQAYVPMGQLLDAVQMWGVDAGA